MGFALLLGRRSILPAMFPRAPGHGHARGFPLVTWRGGVGWCLHDRHHSCSHYGLVGRFVDRNRFGSGRRWSQAGFVGGFPRLSQVLAHLLELPASVSTRPTPSSTRRRGSRRSTCSAPARPRRAPCRSPCWPSRRHAGPRLDAVARLAPGYAEAIAQLARHRRGARAAAPVPRRGARTGPPRPLVAPRSRRARGVPAHRRLPAARTARRRRALTLARLLPPLPVAHSSAARFTADRGRFRLGPDLHAPFRSSSRRCAPPRIMRKRDLRRGPAR